MSWMEDQSFCLKVEDAGESAGFTCPRWAWLNSLWQEVTKSQPVFTEVNGNNIYGAAPLW